MPSIDQFAVILFTLRDHLKTREDALKTFDKVAEIGYKSVQVSGMNPDLFPEEELREEIQTRGLTICATHEPAKKIIEQPQEVITRLKKLGVKYTAYPHPAGVDLNSESDVHALIKGLDESGRQFAEEGLVLCYHNHHSEFVQIGGVPVLEKIYAETDPKHLQGELDTHWVQAGGACIESWIRRMSGRLPLLHIKDYKLNSKFEREFAEIGNGNLNFPDIIKAAEAAGCEYYIVEQDVCPGDPFDSIAQSFDYIQKNLVS